MHLGVTIPKTKQQEIDRVRDARGFEPAFNKTPDIVSKMMCVALSLCFIQPRLRNRYGSGVS